MVTDSFSGVSGASVVQNMCNKNKYDADDDLQSIRYYEQFTLGTNENDPALIN